MLDIKTINDAIASTGVLPVINVPKPELAEPLAKALIDGGMTALEITLRNESALDSVRIIKRAYPEFIVGAGTVLSVSDAERAIAAGADFIVSPGFDEEVVDYCLERGILIVPGCCTPTEMQAAVKKGLTTLKFFPAELSGGMAAIKLLSGPFPKVKFVPTGGITFDNLGEYLSSDKILACGGSFMANADQVKRGDFEAITAACKRAMDISLGFELAHVGINHDSAEQAYKNIDRVAQIFRLGVKDGEKGAMVGGCVELMKVPFYGTKGHIGFKTRSVARALAYFEKNGYKINESSINRDEKGLVSAYLEEEIGGFAFHVVRK